MKNEEDLYTKIVVFWLGENSPLLNLEGVDFRQHMKL